MTDESNGPIQAPLGTPKNNFTDDEDAAGWLVEFIEPHVTASMQGRLGLHGETVRSGLYQIFLQQLRDAGYRHSQAWPLEIGPDGKAPAALKRPLSTYAAMSPLIVASGSQAQAMYALQDMQHDIGALADVIATERAEADKLRKENHRLEGLVYVPGQWSCPKCRFTLIQRSMNGQTGATAVRDEPGEKCPNCKTPLWRVTERDAGDEVARRAEEAFQERAALRRVAAAARAVAEAKLGTPLEDAVGRLSAAVRALDAGDEP